MKDYKRRDLHASHTLGWSWYWSCEEKNGARPERFLADAAELFFTTHTHNKLEVVKPAL